MKDFLYTLILLGSIQGVIMCILLLFYSKKLFANRLLAGIIALITLPGFHLYFHYKNWFETNAVTLFIHDVLPLVVIMPLGPLIYFYIRFVTNSDYRFGAKYWLHFLPLIVDLLPKLVGLAFHVSVWSGHPFASRPELIQIDNLYNQYADIPRWLSMTLYVSFAAHYLYRSTKEFRADLRLINWLHLFTRLFICFQIIWFAYLIPYILPQYSSVLLEYVDWFPIYIPMAILIYWLGIQGYIISQQEFVSKKIAEPVPWLEDAWHRLQSSMEIDQLYLDPGLNLEKLSAHTSLSARQISALLNQHRATNFNSFINQYRLEKFKARLMHPDGNKFTIVGLAMECGFNSAATFQRIFKQSTGMAPSMFLKHGRGQEPIIGDQSNHV